MPKMTEFINAVKSEIKGATTDATVELSQQDVLKMFVMAFADVDKRLLDLKEGGTTNE